MDAIVEGVQWPSEDIVHPDRDEQFNAEPNISANTQVPYKLTVLFGHAASTRYVSSGAITLQVEVTVSQLQYEPTQAA